MHEIHLYPDELCMIKNNLPIGVLALQGDFLEHIRALRGLGVHATEIKLPHQLDAIHGLIIPSGESTTMARLIDEFGLREPLIEKIKKGLPVWGTCAGMILLAKKLREDRPQPLGLMDITVARNDFGRQVNSFETDLKIPVLGNKPFHTVFIRTPKVMKAGSNVKVFAHLPDKSIVAIQQNNMLGTSFHPELTQDTRFHEYFLNLIHKSMSFQKFSP